MDSDESAIANVITILIVIGMCAWLFINYWDRLWKMLMHWGAYAIASIIFALIVLWWSGNL